MSADAEEVRKAILAITENRIQLISEWCTVKTVNDKTCDVIFDDDDDLVIYDVLLGFDKSGVVVKPKLNTYVLVLFINNTKNNGAVIMVQETDDIEIMGNEFGGLVKINPMLEKVNNLENEINELKTIIQAIILSGTTSSGAPVTNGSLAGYFGSYDASPIIPTQLNEIENTKIKHGKG